MTAVATAAGRAGRSDSGVSGTRTWSDQGRRVRLIPRYETCATPGCDRQTYVRTLCRPCYERSMWRRMPQAVPRWRRPMVGYVSAHQRVARLRGPAAEHRCPCGAGARHWSYDHADPDEVLDPRGRRYSLDPMRYLALCIRCHRKLDGIDKLDEHAVRAIRAAVAAGIPRRELAARFGVTTGAVTHIITRRSWKHVA